MSCFVYEEPPWIYGNANVYNIALDIDTATQTVIKMYWQKDMEKAEKALLQPKIEYQHYFTTYNKLPGVGQQTITKSAFNSF